MFDLAEVALDDVTLPVDKGFLTVEVFVPDAEPVVVACGPDVLGQNTGAAANCISLSSIAALCRASSSLPITP